MTWTPLNDNIFIALFDESRNSLMKANYHIGVVTPERKAILPGYASLGQLLVQLLENILSCRPGC